VAIVLQEQGETIQVNAWLRAEADHVLPFITQVFQRARLLTFPYGVPVDVVNAMLSEQRSARASAYARGRASVSNMTNRISGSMSMNGNLKVIPKRNPGLTPEECLASQQQQLDDHRKELDEVWKQIDLDRARYGKVNADTEWRLTASIEALRQTVIGLSVGSIRWPVAGGVLILVGTALIIDPDHA